MNHTVGPTRGYVGYGETRIRYFALGKGGDTYLEVELIRQFHTYSAPNRDARQHNISIVFLA